MKLKKNISFWSKFALSIFTLIVGFALTIVFTVLLSFLVSSSQNSPKIVNWLIAFIWLIELLWWSFFVFVIMWTNQEWKKHKNKLSIKTSEKSVQITESVNDKNE